MDTTLLSIVIAVLGILSTTIVGILAYNLSKQSQRATNQKAIGDLYSEMMKFRVEHPEVMKLSNQWSEVCFAMIYRQATKTERQWAIYYTYVELCLNFCNTVLYGHKTRVLDDIAYKRHYEPLVRLILTEHYPFVLSALNGSYLSSLIREYILLVERNGWNWLAKRNSLIGVNNG